MDGKDFLKRYESGERDFQDIEINFLYVEYELDILDGLDLSNTNLSNWNIENLVFRNSKFDLAVFENVEFNESSFVNNSFIGTTFKYFDAINLYFKNCNLKKASFIECDFGGVFFELSDFSESKWRDNFWTGGLEHCRLNNSIIDNLEIGILHLVDTYLPDGILVDHVWESITIESESFLKAFEKMTSTLSLKTTLGIDSNFGKLETLLSASKWKEADKETAFLMQKIVGETNSGMIKVESVKNFSCTELKMIDDLWKKYSSNMFGFTAQSEIWHSNCEEAQNDINKYRRDFCENLKWCTFKPFRQVVYEPTNGSQNLNITGYLPAIGIWAGLHGVFFFGDDDFECIYHRLLNCDSLSR